MGATGAHNRRSAGYLSVINGKVGCFAEEFFAKKFGRIFRAKGQYVFAIGFYTEIAASGFDDAIQFFDDDDAIHFLRKRDKKFIGQGIDHAEFKIGSSVAECLAGVTI